ncbi:MAG: hypothetical protein UZ21_OP11001000375 [Microgenomates bacterium OLB22]|nr:MAG: hypothetical protein UZ21_OP11001000375 [Microgenomates bacterium OLB22]
MFFFAASLVWFVADYAAKSRANALLVQINPNPGSVSISGGTTATTTLTLEAANGQSISAYDLRFTLEGPVYIQSAAKPVLLGSSLSQDAVTQFILSSDRLSYGFIGSSAQLSSRIEQPIVLACDASGQGKVTISSTSQIVGPSGELQLGTTSPIVVDCQGISGTARPSANSGMVITTNPTQPEQGSPYDVSNLTSLYPQR